MTTSACRSCSAPIRWARTPKGKMIPLDAEPNRDGRIRLGHIGGEEVALVLTDPAEIAAAEFEGELYVSHFATCPQARDWRRR